MATVKLSADTASMDRLLSALTDAADRLPEFREALCCLIDSGDELFRLYCDDVSASGAGEVLVRFDPSDALSGLMAALGAGDGNGFFLEHGASPVEMIDKTTTYEVAQS